MNKRILITIFGGALLLLSSCAVHENYGGYYGHPDDYYYGAPYDYYDYHYYGYPGLESGEHREFGGREFRENRGGEFERQGQQFEHRSEGSESRSGVSSHSETGEHGGGERSRDK